MTSINLHHHIQKKVEYSLSLQSETGQELQSPIHRMAYRQIQDTETQQFRQGGAHNDRNS